ncbi:hypothetical protein [Erythrobacter dokdonensis]|uniref:Uncharacterized protein n=1 Tax=Erythrobacter dokdonensis DSW-74 TaxID=1300349 RepID=A0A1A7BI37_9SPHN|nr:hypothetical protein [Erythrobacter dokdonensis]OBV11376.1 hypothetical protein I603_0819 [Erythrobacter dokdonensis DSW-74]
MTRALLRSPENMMGAFRLFWQARNEVLTQGLITDNWGGIYSCTRIADIMAAWAKYPDIQLLSYKMHPDAEISAAAYEWRENGYASGMPRNEIMKNLRLEHVLPQREMTLHIGAMVDDGKNDEQIFDWIRTHYRVVVLTVQETLELNRRNRSRICPNRMDGIEMRSTERL